MPLFPAWSMSAKRVLSQGFILSGLRRGLSGNRIQSALQLKGLGYRRVNILKDVSYWRDALEKGSQIRYTWKGEVVNSDLYAQTRWRMSARYETVARVRYKDRITGESHEDYVTVTHTHLEDGIEKPDLYQSKTRQEIEDAARSAVIDTSPGGDNEVTEVTPMMGFYNPMVG